MQTGSALRSLFAIILLSCVPTSPEVLWDRHRQYICDDVRHRLERHPWFSGNGNRPAQQIEEDHVYDYGLHLLNKILMKSGKVLGDFPPMPLPQGLDGQPWEVIDGNFLLAEQLDYDPIEQGHLVKNNLRMFNDEQRTAYNDIMDSVEHERGRLFFLHSAGGCGKTFVCNTIAAATRSQEKIALCVASSGIASLLLEGGRTAHSCFKIPIPVTEASVARIKKDSHMHEVLRQTKIIIWDEVPMQHKHAVHSVDRALRDLLGNEMAFGGITVLFGGDFRQTLPVVPKGMRQQIVAASLCRSYLWNDVQVHFLTRNMRLDQSDDSVRHAVWLLEIGAGTNLDDSEKVWSLAILEKSMELIGIILKRLNCLRPCVATQTLWKN